MGVKTLNLKIKGVNCQIECWILIKQNKHKFWQLIHKYLKNVWTPNIGNHSEIFNIY